MRSRTMRADDRHGEPVGRLVDVWRSAASGLSWGLVRSGRLRSRRALVPLRDATYGPGRVRLAVDAAALRAAPPAGRASPTAADELVLRRHYGL